MHMLVKGIFISLFLIGAQAAVAAPQDKYYLEQGVTLWGQLKTGMTKADVATLDLENNFELTRDCRVKLKLRYKDDGLFSVAIDSRWFAAYNRWAELIERSLVAKYGNWSGLEIKTDDKFGPIGNYFEQTWLTDKLIVSLGYRYGRLLYITYQPRLIKKRS